jgi:hypothetical protein
MIGRESWLSSTTVFEDSVQPEEAGPVFVDQFQHLAATTRDAG